MNITRGNPACNHEYLHAESLSAIMVRVSNSKSNRWQAAWELKLKLVLARKWRGPLPPSYLPALNLNSPSSTVRKFTRKQEFQHVLICSKISGKAVSLIGLPNYYLNSYTNFMLCCTYFLPVYLLLSFTFKSALL
jgi:hypothetical protein